MENEEIVKFVIDQLGKHRRPNDVIREVCERSGMQWSDAQRFVKRVYVEHRSDIKGRQNRLLSAVGIVTVMAGYLLLWASS